MKTLIHLSDKKIKEAIKISLTGNCGPGVYFFETESVTVSKAVGSKVTKHTTTFSPRNWEYLVAAYGKYAHILSVDDSSIINAEHDYREVILRSDRDDVYAEYAGKFVRFQHEQWGTIVVLFDQCVGHTIKEMEEGVGGYVDYTDTY